MELVSSPSEDRNHERKNNDSGRAVDDSVLGGCAGHNTEYLHFAESPEQFSIHEWHIAKRTANSKRTRNSNYSTDAAHAPNANASGSECSRSSAGYAKQSKHSGHAN
jgi:hypothetical protein